MEPYWTKIESLILKSRLARMFLAEERERERESTEQKGAEVKFRAQSPIWMGLKIVATISATEFVIMLALYSWGAATRMPLYLLALIDTLTLSIVTAIVVIYSVVKPMQMYYQERLQTAEALRKKEEHHKAVIENIFKFVPEGVLVLTESLNLLKHNKAFDDIVQKYAPLLGYTEEELAEKISGQLRSKIATGDAEDIRIAKKKQ